MGSRRNRRKFLRDSLFLHKEELQCYRSWRNNHCLILETTEKKASRKEEIKVSVWLLLGYFCVQATRAQLYGMIGGRIHVIECILLL
uniref:Uncharacterized protein n=2 Tax=Brassica oleracea TaxID=3712 RepID=A0A0D3CRZ9_BRAOL|nr:unnamed protein product [Brassica oleracea]